MSETHDPWKDVTWFVACQHCGATTTRGNLTFSGGLHCTRCDDITEMPQEVAYRANIDAARAAEATQHQQEIAAKDETIRQQACIIELDHMSKAELWRDRKDALARLVAVEAERDEARRMQVGGDLHSQILKQVGQIAVLTIERDRLKAALEIIDNRYYLADIDSDILRDALGKLRRAALSGEGTKP